MHTWREKRPTQCQLGAFYSQAQTLSCVRDYTTAYREPVVDLERVPKVMWNSTFKDKLVPKNLFDLAQPDPEHKAVKGMHVRNCKDNLPTLIG